MLMFLLALRKRFSLLMPLLGQVRSRKQNLHVSQCIVKVFLKKKISLWSGWAKALLSLAHSGKVLGAGGGEPLSSLPLPESPQKKSVKNYYKERKLAVKSLPSPSPSSPPLLPTSPSARALVTNLGSNGSSSRLASMFRLSVRTCWRKRLGG